MSERDAPGAGPAPARRAVSLIFLLNGAVIASWLPHIPGLKSRLLLDDGGLGLLLLAMATGAILALPIAGWLVATLGSRVVTSASAVVRASRIIQSLCWTREIQTFWPLTT